MFNKVLFEHAVLCNGDGISTGVHNNGFSQFAQCLGRDIFKLRGNGGTRLGHLFERGVVVVIGT